MFAVGHPRVHHARVVTVLAMNGDLRAEVARAMAAPLPPVSPSVRSRFSSQVREGTKPELALRSELHRRGRRFRVQYPVPGNPRRRIDIAFPRARIAVFVDGCFWHGCPEHFVPPRHNRAWWLAKVAVNRDRDEDTIRALRNIGWTVLRTWEHDSAPETADRVEAFLDRCR
ncbi:very short patch repair endonuclease [Naumannella huperziae]